ncbi:Arc family DNA-binding protein [Escherichia coli]
MYSKYDEAQFHLRLPHELHAKIKLRAKMNNRSLNSEIIAAIEESLDKQSSASVYIDDAERMAEQQSDMVKKIVFDTLKDYIKKTADNHPWLSVTSGYHHCSSST